MPAAVAPDRKLEREDALVHGLEGQAGVDRQILGGRSLRVGQGAPRLDHPTRAFRFPAMATDGRRADEGAGERPVVGDGHQAHVGDRCLIRLVAVQAEISGRLGRLREVDLVGVGRRTGAEAFQQFGRGHEERDPVVPLAPLRPPEQKRHEPASALDEAVIGGHVRVDGHVQRQHLGAVQGGRQLPDPAVQRRHGLVGPQRDEDRVG